MSTGEVKKPEVSAETKAEAEIAKTEGNAEFKQSHYEAAVNKYTAAIELWPTNHVYYANRSICHLKMENYGLALSDSQTCIDLEPTYAKGWYRRASAHLALAKLKEALNDYRAVLKIAKNDRTALNKVKVIKKEIRDQAFAEAIAQEVKMWHDIDLPELYDGAVWDDATPITLSFVQDMMERFKNSKNFAMKYQYRIVQTIEKQLKQLPSLVDVPIPENTEITVCGDTHGQFFDVMHIFEVNGMPTETNPYLFNGDFVDRGSWSLEVILTLFALKLIYPDSVHLVRGNHETRGMNNAFGFKGEVQHKADLGLFEAFCEAFNWLPLAYVLNEKVFVTHGGLFSQDGVTLDDIREIKRNCQPPDTGLMTELLWADPHLNQGRGPSKRGVGLCFGPDVTNAFLETNNLKLVVRSHEVKDQGYEVIHDGKLITIFSAPNYCDNVGNKGAWIRFGPECEPKFTQFSAVPHPNIQPMAYQSQAYR